MKSISIAVRGVIAQMQHAAIAKAWSLIPSTFHAFKGTRADKPCETCARPFIHPLHRETWTVPR